MGQKGILMTKCSLKIKIFLEFVFRNASIIKLKATGEQCASVSLTSNRSGKKADRKSLAEFIYSPGVLGTSSRMSSFSKTSAVLPDKIRAFI